MSVAFLLGSALVATFFAGFIVSGRGSDSPTSSEGEQAGAPSASLVDEDGAGEATPEEADGGLGAIPDPADLPQGDDPDRMSIQIETTSGAERGGATATVRDDGRVHFEGSFRSQEEADRYVARAREVFGAEAVVESYAIDPDAPPPSAGDVALDKPVLFETGSAEIHPDYVPYLEACGDVLKLNPDITMSISAFTDSVGDEDFNLELSQQRAQAIVDFYAERQVDQSQLVSTGLGEDAPFDDNDTEEGRRQNRRAMLQLLNVMGDSQQPAE